jgi:GTP pyrophosphokinase
LIIRLVLENPSQKPSALPASAGAAEAEKEQILRAYKALLRSLRPTLGKGDKKMIRLAFDLSLEAHKDMRRKTGEPYILHPLAVAQICAEEIGLGPLAIVCALLHDTVEDTHLTLDDIRSSFGEKAAVIVDGLTKISGVVLQGSSIQAENFRKMLLTLSDDVRVILIKLADRLHNMRTLDSMAREKQLKIASETAFLYAPLAHRLGLYSIKTELEDLALKYTEPEIYNEIASKLQQTKRERTRFINEFMEPVREELNRIGFKYEVRSRTKSVQSIWNKMKRQGVGFEEIFDIFAVRIVIDASEEEEKSMCWRCYSVFTDFYTPNPDRLRDWISTPKANGYESLHTTVMGPGGRWVEVQIRSRRMDDIAEKGYAAHWKYKEPAAESALDDWIKKIRELLESPESNALDFIDDFKLNLFSDEIFVFTPTGDIKILPAGATALDFAFEIHTDLGSRCIGAKTNHKLVPLSHRLRSGDQVEILTSRKQTPKDDWLNYVVTAKAKSKIKGLLKEEKKLLADDGKEILERKFKHLKLNFTTENINELLAHFRVPSSLELYYRIAKGMIDLYDLKDFEVTNGYIRSKQPVRNEQQTLEQMVKTVRGSSDMLVLGENLDRIDYKLSPCCNPIPGDDVFGFITVGEGIKIHRVNCPNAVQLMSNYAYRIVKAKWTGQQEIAFLAGVRMTGIDEVGVVNKISKVISSELKVNMRSISIDSNDGIFEGTIMLFVHDTHHLDKLIKKLKEIHGILTVSRIDGK